MRVRERRRNRHLNVKVINCWSSCFFYLMACSSIKTLKITKNKDKEQEKGEKNALTRVE